MSKTDWLKPLQGILDCKVKLKKFTQEEWTSWIGQEQAEQNERNADERQDSLSNSHENWNVSRLLEGQRIELRNKTLFIIMISERHIELLEVGSSSLTSVEKELISWTLSQIQNYAYSKAADSMSESERIAIKLSEWIQKQLESDEPGYSLPDHLTAGSRFFQDMIPFLLVTEQTGIINSAYSELEKLLRSFLSDEVLLIPLKSQEWLIWGPVSLLKDEESDVLEGAEEESLEDSLSSIAIGLQEMLQSEWLGECHLAVTYPLPPSEGMLEATILLRETINLGRKFHVGTNIHLPWMLQLERLLNAIPEPQRARYLEQSLKRTDLFVESEMLGTLETFFALDCNVSETAKMLYIHRNTLLYRLDKLKQETGLDVRQFRDAVLVKIILLLYKVTKRN